MGFQRALFMPLMLLIAGCGPTVIGINHTLTPRSPSEKPTAACKSAEMGVYALVNKAAGFRDTSSIPLGNGGCAVGILVESPNNVIHMLDAIKDTSKSYTYFRSETVKTYTNVWVDQLPQQFKDGSGKTLDTSPTNEDCNTAREQLKKIFDNVAFSVIVDRKTTTGPRRCYVEAVFTGPSHSANFERFMDWKNPPYNEPFHYYVTKGSTTKVVYIHAVDPVQN